MPKSPVIGSRVKVALSIAHGQPRCTRIANIYVSHNGTTIYVMQDGRHLGIRSALAEWPADAG